MMTTASDDDEAFHNDAPDRSVNDDEEAADESMSRSDDGLIQSPDLHRSSKHRRSRLFIFVALFALICSVIVVVLVETSGRSSAIPTLGNNNNAPGPLGPDPNEDDITKDLVSLDITKIAQDRTVSSNGLLNPDGSLAYGVTFSKVFHLVVKKYMSATEVDMDRLNEMDGDDQEHLLEKALRRMEENTSRPSITADSTDGGEDDETKTPATDPLSGISFEQLRRAILKDDFASSLDRHHEPWGLYTDALSVMRKVEYDGRPIPIELYPNLYIGSAGAAYNFSALVAANISHILDVTPSVIPRFPGVFEYMHIADVHDYDEVEDGDQLAQYFPYSTQFIGDALGQGGTVLVHCSEGRSRSATLIAVYLMQTQGFFRDEALSLIRRTRPIAYPSSSFMIVMERLERSMREGRADGDGSPLPNGYKIFAEDGSLASGIAYSDIRRAVVEEYFDVSLFNGEAAIRSWDQLQLALNEMELADEVASGGPLAGVSFEDLAHAVLSQFNRYFVDVDYPWANLLEALWVMRLIEVDGEPVPIGQDWWNDFIPPALYVGGAGAAFNHRALKDAGITHIVSASPSIGEIYSQDFEYFLVFNADATDADSRPQDESLEEFFHPTYTFIHNARKQGGKVLVVCDDGTSTSPVILAAFLMREEGMRRSDALHRIKRVRTTTILSDLHQNDLKALERKLIREGVIED